MAHFYGSMRSGRGKVTRTGTPSAGIFAHIRGWDAGVTVSCYSEDGNDYFAIHATRGSNGGSSSAFRIGTLRLIDGRLEFEPSPEALGTRGSYVVTS